MPDQKVLGYYEVSGRFRDGHTPRRKLVIEADGSIRGLYDDSLVGLGEVQDVTRASHVEWSAGHGGIPKGWYVLLAVDARNGPNSGCLIGQGFATRADALAFEVAWLQENTLK